MGTGTEYEKRARERLEFATSIACALCGVFIFRAYECDLEGSFFYCTSCAPVGP